MTPEWKNHPDTIRFYNIVQKAIADATNEVLGVKGNTPGAVAMNYKHATRMLESLLLVRGVMESVPDDEDKAEGDAE